MTCKEAEELLARYVFGELEESDRERFEQHAAGCEPCRSAAAEMTAVTELLRQGIEDDGGPVLSDRRRAELFAAAENADLGEEPVDAIGDGSGDEDDTTEVLCFPAFTVWRVAGAAAAFAVLAAGLSVLFSTPRQDSGEGIAVVPPEMPAEQAPSATGRTEPAGMGESVAKVEASAPEAVPHLVVVHDVEPEIVPGKKEQESLPETSLDAPLPAVAAAPPKAASPPVPEQGPDDVADDVLRIKDVAPEKAVADLDGVLGVKETKELEELRTSIAERLERRRRGKALVELITGEKADKQAAATGLNGELGPLGDLSRHPVVRPGRPELQPGEPAPSDAESVSPATGPAPAAPDGVPSVQEPGPVGTRRRRRPEAQQTLQEKGTALTVPAPGADRQEVASLIRGLGDDLVKAAEPRADRGMLGVLPEFPRKPELSPHDRDLLRRRAGWGSADAHLLAVPKGLTWLRSEQNPDGSWSKTQPEAATALALLAFLAHEQTPVSREYGLTVQRAMRFVTNRMLEGRTSPNTGLVRPEVNGMVTTALAEAYGATRIPFLRPAMEKGLRFIVNGQLDSGGFGRKYGDSEDNWDLVTTEWQIEALTAAHRAGARVPGLAAVAEKSAEFLKGQCLAVSADKKRGYFRLRPDGRTTAATQSVGTWALQALGEERSREARAGVRFLSRSREDILVNVADEHPCSIPFYTWYCTSRAMWHGGATAWRRWRRIYPEHIAGLQLPDGHWVSPVSDKNRQEYEPYYSTALACLSLEVHRRNLVCRKVTEPSEVADDTGALTADDVVLNFRLQVARKDDAGEQSAEPEDETGPGSAAFVPSLVSTAECPVAVLSADPNSASRDLAESYLLDAQEWPPPGAIRVDEFVDGFDYRYPPRQGKPLAVHVDAVPSPLRPHLMLLRVAFLARHVFPADRHPVSLAVVVEAPDTGTGEEMPASVRQAVRGLADGLATGDRIAIVAGGRSPRTLVGPVPASCRDTVLAALSGLEDTGPPCLASALDVAREALSREHVDNELQHILVFSRGREPAGRAELDATLESVLRCRQNGVRLSCAGFGRTALDSGVLEGLAAAGGGTCLAAATEQGGGSAFGDVLPHAFQVVAEDVSVRMAFSPTAVLRYRVIGDGDVAEPSPGGAAGEGGRFGDGQKSTALFELDVPAGDEDELGTLTLSYRQPGVPDPVSMRVPISRRVVFRKPSPAQESSLFLAACVAEFAEILADAEGPDLERLRWLDGVLRKRSRKGQTDPQLAQLGGLVTKAVALLQ